MEKDVYQRIDDLEEQVKNLKEMLETTIIWMAQSANSPISIDEAQRLLKIGQRNDKLSRGA